MRWTDTAEQMKVICGADTLGGGVDVRVCTVVFR
jgi:hypothetical protein